MRPFALNKPLFDLYRRLSPQAGSHHNMFLLYEILKSERDALTVTVRGRLGCGVPLSQFERRTRGVRVMGVGTQSL